MFKRHRNFCIFLFMLILVPLAGEPKFHPFSGDFQNFRVSFGSPVFLLFLLWLRRVPFLVSGISTGIAVVVFRGLLDVWTGGVSLSAGIWAHAPTFFYYFTYAGFFILPNFDKNHIDIFFVYNTVLYAKKASQTTICRLKCSCLFIKPTS